MLGGFLATLGIAFVIQGLAGTRSSATVSLGSTVLGVAWIALGLGHILLLREIAEQGRLAVYTVLLTVFAADTVAYFAGRLFGRHKLAPRISPGKTREGLVGAVLFAMVAGAVCMQFLITHGAWWQGDLCAAVGQSDGAAARANDRLGHVGVQCGSTRGRCRGRTHAPVPGTGGPGSHPGPTAQPG